MLCYFCLAAVQKKRRFPESMLRTGQPHLLVVPPGNVPI